MHQANRLFNGRDASEPKSNMRMAKCKGSWQTASTKRGCFSVCREDMLELHMELSNHYEMAEAED